MYHKFHSDLRRIYVRFVFLGKHTSMTAEEIDASFLRRSPPIPLHLDFLKYFASHFRFR